eukprot:GHVR01014276.1.p1 GENE.GHVR01014276.1~~GHVR01014276.1.p1  ORF type:complete len:290 (-),score=74.36 GHVR01014276.1:106-975(-)
MMKKNNKKKKEPHTTTNTQASTDPSFNVNTHSTNGVESSGTPQSGSNSVDEYSLGPDGITIETNRMNTCAEIGEVSCEYLCKLSDEPHDTKNGWVDQKFKNPLIFKKDVQGAPPIGRAEVIIPAAEGVTLDEAFDYLWDPNIKKQYDVMLERTFMIREYPPKNIGIMYQAMYGKFGVRGRDFVVICASKKDTELHPVTNTCRRATIGVKSVEEEMTHPDMNTRLVRATAVIAGYDIKVLDNGDLSITYINQADLNGSIPEWMLSSAKNDQLKVLAKVKELLIKQGKANK